MTRNLDSRISSLVTRCVYRIATGTWREGQRLPSIRAAETAWGVERRTVLKAYRRLEAMGIVHSTPRSGFYVGAAAGGPLARHRYAIDRLFRDVSEIVRSRSGLSPLGVFRYFAEYAEIRCDEAPEVAFVECTASQASGHAAEIRARLAVPCLPLTLGQAAAPRSLPIQVRTVLVSAFHATELAPVREDSAVTVHAVPIELSPAIEVGDGARSAFLIEYDATEAQNIAEDLRLRLPGVDVEPRAVEDLDRFLSGLSPDAGSLPRPVFLAPRVWNDLPERWRDHPRIREARFSILESAWPGIAEAIGLPLGSLG